MSGARDPKTKLPAKAPAAEKEEEREPVLG